jgi:mono/diheme cytochrome c family protein
MKFLVSRGLAGLAFTVLSGAAMAGAPDAQLEHGKTLFKSGAVPACAICHALKDADATGAIGPDLDELKPDAERIKKVLKEGAGSMPSFAATMSDEDMDAVAAYVVHATGGDK